MSLKERLKSFTPDALIGLRSFWLSHRTIPNLLRPATFHEKILYRRLLDRRPILTEIADKYAVRSYVQKRLGAEILPKLYFVTRSPKDIPFDELPDQFVAKPTHGSGWVRVITDKSRLDRTSFIAECEYWLTQSYYESTREWQYKDIVPQIIVEEFINDAGRVASDYKLYVFHGTTALIHVDVGRFTDHRRALFTPAWEKLKVTYIYPDIDGELAKPVHLREMIKAAEVLAGDFDFIRVDFYDTGRKLYFGELTATPGIACFNPKEFDHYLGNLWRLT